MGAGALCPWSGLNPAVPSKKAGNLSPMEHPLTAPPSAQSPPFEGLPLRTALVWLLRTDCSAHRRPSRLPSACPHPTPSPPSLLSSHWFPPQWGAFQRPLSLVWAQRVWHKVSQRGILAEAPGACRGSSLKPLKSDARAAQGAGVGSENGEGEEIAEGGLQGGS